MNSDLGNWLCSIGFSGNEGVCMICAFACFRMSMVSTGSHSNAANLHRLFVLFVPDMEDDVMMQNSEHCMCECSACLDSGTGTLHGAGMMPNGW